MGRKERLQAFTAQYDQEARAKYGHQQVEDANRKMMHLPEEQFARWQALDAQILTCLEAAVTADLGADSGEAKEIAQLHKEWLMISVPSYTTQMHRGIAMMYVCDERFTQYYDRNVTGCAKLLSDAVQHWI